MTRKDYIKFAKFWKDHKEISVLSQNDQWAKAVEASFKDFADLLADDNPRFDRQKFFKACGL